MGALGWCEIPTKLGGGLGTLSPLHTAFVVILYLLFITFIEITRFKLYPCVSCPAAS